MNRRVVLVVAIVIAAAESAAAPLVVRLPEPDRVGEIPLETVLQRRRSHRHLAPTPLPRAVVGQLLWAAQGVTGDAGGRTAPSAGALYPVALYTVTAEGVFLYRPDRHELVRMQLGDRRVALWRTVHAPSELARAPVIFVLTVDDRRTRARYGMRADRYALLEAGHAAQNLLLQATALGLHGLGIGAFRDDDLKRAVGLGPHQAPVYVLPIGRPPSAAPDRGR